MRLVIQRVLAASVSVSGETISAIDQGLLVLAGVTHSDTDAVARQMADKLVGLRLFEDADQRMNLSVTDVGGAVLCVSQFTLYGDTRRGRRPSFDGAAPAPVARPVYETLCNEITSLGVRCERGVFGAEMQVSLINDGPVTLLLDSAELGRPRRT